MPADLAPLRPACTPTRGTAAAPAARRRPRVVLLVPDGMSVRNFVHGAFLGHLAEFCDVHVLHAVFSEDASLLGVRAPGVGEHVLRGADMGGGARPLAHLLRLGLASAHQRWGDTPAMRFNLARRPAGRARRRAFAALAHGIGRAAANPAGLRALERANWRLWEGYPATAEYRALFARLRPDLVLSATQKSDDNVAPVLAARALGVPAATFIASWDNLTSKGRITAPFDHFFVWSEHMRAELHRFYPHVAADRVRVVGTPQFDPHGDPALHWTRETLCARIGADPGRPLVCYSGGTPDIVADDPHHVAAVARCVREATARGLPHLVGAQVVVRPAPTDDGSRFADVRREFPEVLYLQPEWARLHATQWTRVVPAPADIALFANLVRHADVNVNVASTMTLDFAIHDRPVVNVAYDATTPPPLGRPVWDEYYQFDHYRTVVDAGAADIVRSPAALGPALEAALADPSARRAERQRLVALHVGVAPGASSRHFADAVHALAAASAARADAH